MSAWVHSTQGFVIYSHISIYFVLYSHLPLSGFMTQEEKNFLKEVLFNTGLLQ